MLGAGAKQGFSAKHPGLSGMWAAEGLQILHADGKACGLGIAANEFELGHAGPKPGPVRAAWPCG